MEQLRYNYVKVLDGIPLTSKMVGRITYIYIVYFTNFFSRQASRQLRCHHVIFYFCSTSV